MPTTTAPTSTATTPAPTGSGKKPVLTLERQAADALRAGRRDQAAQLYDQLAAQHPENPAYKEAARILRAPK
jgi:outer membrane protein assembly factor BamD (BamD/ComL family)